MLPLVVCSSESDKGLKYDCDVGSQINFVRQPIVSERGTAAVIDGCRLLLTPLRHTVIPPPMCAVTAHAAAPITALAFCNDGPCEVWYYC